MTIDRGGAFPPLVELTLMRFREFVREPETLFWALLFPIVMAVALAVAFPSRPPQPVPVAVTAGEGAAAVRESLRRSGDIVLREVAAGDEDRALRAGDVHLIVVPTSPPSYRFDAAREDSRLARLVVDDALQRAAGRTDPWTARTDPMTVAGSRYIDWLIPGLVGMGVMNGLWGVGFSIVQARMRRLLRWMIASPMQRRDYLLGQMLARLTFLAVEVVVPLVFGIVVFGVPMNGSIGALAVVSVVGALSFAALGLLLASRVRTIEAISGLTNLVVVPMWIVGGVFFSSRNFPDVAQPVIQAMPLTALNDALRAVILDGTPLAGVAGELALLGIWGVVPFFVALAIFKWR